MREFENKNAIITGANRGIGNAIVKKFAENGCNIWACARAKTESFERQMADFSEQYNVVITPVYFELTDENQIKDAIKIIYKEKVNIDIMVNAAGIVHTDLFQMTSMSTMRNVFDTNFFGPVTLTQLVLKIMSRGKKGNIINIASIAGLDANPTNCTYGSSKAAMISFTKILASEVAMMGIRVNAIAPGPTNTDMVQIVEKKVGDALLDRCAMKRLAEADEVAEVAVFLASEKSSFVNGQVLRVDGGAR